MSTYQNSLIYIYISLNIPCFFTYTTSSSVICFIASLSLPLISCSHCTLVPCPCLLLILSLGMHMTSYQALIGGQERQKVKENQRCPLKCTSSSRGHVLTIFRLFISIMFFDSSIPSEIFCFTIGGGRLTKRAFVPDKGMCNQIVRSLCSPALVLPKNGNGNNSILRALL